MSDMSTAKTTIAFDGPALHQGTIDVRTLAPALLAFGHLCEEANRVLNGDRVSVAVRVRADFQVGSFEVNLEVIQSLVGQAWDLLRGDFATSAANLLAFVAAGGGLIALLKRLKGRSPSAIVKLQDGGVVIELEDGTRLETRPEVVDLLRDLRVRQAVEGVTKPLSEDGIERLEIREGETVVQTVERVDVPALIAPPVDDVLLIEERRRAAFSIVSLAFKDETKWRLSDGQGTFLASIRDEDFLGLVNRNEIAFSKGDVLLADILVRQWQSASGVRTEYEVLKVTEHRSAARQIPLPLSAPIVPETPVAPVGEDSATSTPQTGAA
jgi:hypothetical protein